MVKKMPLAKSSFLSTEKDMNLIVNAILKNERLKRLLHYTTRDALNRKNLTERERKNNFSVVTLKLNDAILSLKDVLIALSISGTYNPVAKEAYKNLKKLLFFPFF